MPLIGCVLIAASAAGALQNVTSSATGSIEGVVTDAGAASAPTIISAPRDALGQVGGQVSFSVAARGSPPVSYQWFRGVAPIGGATGDTLLLSNLQASDFTAYHVVVTNSVNSAVSADATLFEDSDEDGMADSWETVNFGNLAQTSLGDADNDGVTNVEEYLDGTNPGSSASHFYRLAVFGGVEVSPLQDRYAPNTPVTLTALVNGAGAFLEWNGSVAGSQNPLALLMDGDKSVTAVRSAFAGDAGWKATATTPNDGGVFDALVLPDDKIVVAGRFSTINGYRVQNLARLNADSTFDPTFNTGLGTTDNSNIWQLARQADGRILACGDFTSVDGKPRLRVARFNTDGSLDETFSSNPDNTVYAILPLGDGRIVIGGVFSQVNSTARNGIAILNADGSLDGSFNPGTGFNSYVVTIQVLPGKKLVAGGYFTQFNGANVGRIAKVNFDGTLDASFNSGGAGFNNEVEVLVSAPGDRLLAAGNFTQYNGVSQNYAVLLDSTGAIDASFDAGNNLNGAVRGASRQSDGKFLLTGDFTAFGATTRQRVLRLNSNGTLDGTFSTLSGANGRSWSAVQQSGGNVIVGGQFSTFGGAFHSQLAVLDGTTAALTAAAPSAMFRSLVLAVNVAPDGSLFTGGDFLGANGTAQTRLAKFKPDGSLDPAFVFQGANSTVRAIEREPGGGILIGGNFSQIGAGAASGLARLDASGARVAGFPAGTGFYGGEIRAIVRQADGAIVVGGEFNGFNGVELPALVRLLADGSLDGSFNGGLGFNNGAPVSSAVYAIAVRNDNRVVVGGEFGFAGGLERVRVARFLTDGTIDSTFDPGAGPNSTVYAVASLPDGSALVGGAFNQVNGVVRQGFAKLLPGGLVDQSFSSPTGGVDGTVYQIAALPSGRILIAGDFSNVGGRSARRVALLNPDGTLDTSFTPGASLDDNVYALSAGSDGSVFLGGWVRQHAGKPFAGLLRLVNSPGMNVEFTGTAPSSPVTVGQAVTLNATAASADGTVVAVAFEASGDGLTFAPAATGISPTPGAWSGTWKPALPGSYYLRATAYDSNTAQRSSTAFGPFSVTPNGTAPTVTTLAATDVVATKAKLNGTVNPQGGATAVSFQYGVSTAYGATQLVADSVSGSSDLAVGFTPTGLAPETTYHFRLVAVNPGGTSYGQDAMFTTPVNTLPVANDDGPFVLLGGGAAGLAVLANDNDPDDDPLTIAHVTTPAHGMAVITGDTVTYTPGNGYIGLDSFGYTIADTRGGTASAMVRIEASFTRPPNLQRSELASTAGNAPAGPPAGTKITGFGPPALSDFRQVAALVSMKSGSTKLAGIFYEDAAGTAALPAWQGMTAPETGGAIFKSFHDPVIAPSGAIAFIGRLQVSKNDDGLWTNAFDAAGELHLVLREGTVVVATGLQPGSTLKSITSISLRDDELLALVQLASGPGFVHSGNDTVLLRITAAGRSVAAREGGWVELAAANIKTLTVMGSALGSPGHGRWQGQDAAIAKAVLTDKRTVVLELPRDAAQVPALITGSAATAVSALTQWTTFALPAIAHDASGMVIGGTVNPAAGVATKKDDTVLLFSADAQNFTVFAREGGTAPDSGGATFATFFDPVVNNGDVLFMATLAGAGVSGANKTALWWGAPGALEIVARLGASAPDAAGQTTVPASDGPIWKGLNSYALPAGADAGPLFVAKLGGSGVTTITNLGVWAVDSTGLLRQILRTGPTDLGAAGTKTITKFNLLNAVPGAFGATRSFNAAGSVAVQVIYADKSQGLLRLDLP